MSIIPQWTYKPYQLARTALCTTSSSTPSLQRKTLDPWRNTSVSTNFSSQYFSVMLSQEAVGSCSVMLEQCSGRDVWFSSFRHRWNKRGAMQVFLTALLSLSLNWKKKTKTHPWPDFLCSIQGSDDLWCGHLPAIGQMPPGSWQWC